MSSRIVTSAIQMRKTAAGLLDDGCHWDSLPTHVLPMCVSCWRVLLPASWSGFFVSVWHRCFFPRRTQCDERVMRVQSMHSMNSLCTTLYRPPKIIHAHFFSSRLFSRTFLMSSLIFFSNASWGRFASMLEKARNSDKLGKAGA